MMACTFIVLVSAVLAAQALASKETAVSALSFDERAAKNRPVSKVITLLKDMSKQMEKEGEEDQDLYDKMACWCETNDKDKTKAVADAEAHIDSLTSKIEELTATSGRLNTEVKNLNAELAKNQDALDSATSIRQKQLAEFNGEEKDMLGSVSALKSAVTVLSKHHSAEFLQMPRSHKMAVAATLEREMKRHVSLLQGVISPSERRTVASFIQSPEDSAPQSGEIFGILKQMKESFETNLADSQKEEMTNQQAYSDLKAAKEEEIKAGTEQMDAKSTELAEADEVNAQSKEDLEDTQDSLASDQEFLAMLKDKCANTDKEMEERQKTRQLEMEACSKALSVLSSDDAHDLFTKTFNPALLQSQTTVHSERRERAATMLAKAAKEMHSPRLATLATKIRLDAFTKVKEAIDAMVTQLGKEKEDEIKHKDFCVDEFNKNQMETEQKEREKEDTLAKENELEMKMKTLSEALEATKGEIAEMQVQLKRAGEDREKQNKEFQMTVADQRATQKLLGAALKILKGFYEKKAKAAAMMQTDEPAGPAPPSGFDSYKNNEASGGVMGMIQQIINDAIAMEKEAIRDEEDGQKAYEAYVKNSNVSIQTKSKEIVNKSEEKSKAEAESVSTKEQRDSILTELEQMSNENAQLHQSCDFITKNFEVRQTARDEEVEALKQAKAILSGSKFEEFLQTA